MGVQFNIAYFKTFPPKNVYYLNPDFFHNYLRKEASYLF